MSCDSPLRDDRYGVSIAEVEAARRRISEMVVRTPLVPSRDLSRRLDLEVRLKLESVQPTGSFKLRGAANAILTLDDETRRRGVVAQSSGNHGRAVAWVARRLGIPAVVFAPTSVVAAKIDAIRRLGAEVVLTDGGHRESIRLAIHHAEERSMTFLPPFDHPAVIAGQGTIGLELLEEWPEVDAVVAPLSGGGLLGGLAVGLGAGAPEIHLTGVSMAGGAAMVESVAAGEMVEVTETPTLADALVGALPLDNRYTFRLCRDRVHRLATVDESEIQYAMRWALEFEGLVVEGGAAVALAWLLAGRHPRRCSRVAVVVSGRNIEGRMLREVLTEAAGEIPVG